MVSLRFDLRAAPFGPGHPELYEAALASCEWAEKHFDAVIITLSEHHASSDGYLPSPLVAAAAVAGRTRKAQIMIAALILPLYDVLRLAEDLAVLDLVSGGRVMPIFAAGYRHEEFDMFGVDLAERGALMDEGIAALEQAWTGEPFEYRGRTVRVTPRPGTQPRPPILMGGSSAAAARRAARVADYFIPSTPASEAAYQAELTRLGKPAMPSAGVDRVGPVVLVHPDIDEGWDLVGQHLLHDTQTYAAWLRDGSGGTGPYSHADTVDEVRAGDRYRIITPGECEAMLRDEGGLDLAPLVGGIPPEVAMESLDRIAAIAGAR